jgi:hypothetical protein
MTHVLRKTLEELTWILKVGTFCCLWLPCQQQPSVKVILIGNTSPTASYEETFEDTKGGNHRKYTKDRQCNDQKKKDKGKNNDLQITTWKN